MAHDNTPRPLRPLAELQAAFVAVILPCVQKYAQITFRHLRYHDREDAQADMLGFAWAWCLKLIQQGKDPAALATNLAFYAARRVKARRHLCGKEKSKDVMSLPAHRVHHFDALTLSPEDRDDNPVQEALRDNTQSPVPDQAAFRLDFPAWIRSYSERDRHVIHDLMMGERTLDVSRRHGMSPGRISQKRREYLEGWSRFQGDDPFDRPPAMAA
jgi:hypothetical protein